jgi:ornithine cyclodeaminase/alanine dehydrogenase-like protein (mu-crystallin family)
MAEHRLLYLSQADVIAARLSMAEIIAALEVAFRAKGEGRTDMPPKTDVHPGGGNNFIHAMPAYIPDLKSAGVKWVSGFPENYKQGLPYITGLLIYNDVETGLPLAVMDCVWITAKRTGAASAIAGRHLARPESSVMGMLGYGVQGRSHAEAFKALFPIRKIMAYDADTVVSGRYAAEIGNSLGIEVVPVKAPREAVSGCDIVVTAGPILKIPHATAQSSWLEEGAFASLVDYDSYWSRDALTQAAKFCTDDVPQLKLYQSMGFFQNIPAIHADLGELVTGKKKGRENATERTMTMNLGLAIDDMAVAPLVYQRAKENGIGTWLTL